MMDVRVEAVDCGRWRELACGFSDYNYRQVWAFGQACAARVGAASEHVAIACGTGVLALANVRVKRTPLWHTGIAYINGGPLVRREAQDDVDRLRLTLAALRRTYVQERRLLLRVAPCPGPAPWSEQQQELYHRAGFTQSQPTRNRTILIDLTATPAELRKALDGKWRNNLNQAERSGLSLRTGTDAALLEDFCRLHRQLVERKRFAVDLDADFYAQVQAQLPDGDRFEVTLAEKDGEPLAGHVAALHGDTAVYLLGASSEAGLKARAAFLLQWETLTRARNAGYRWYDLGGIDPQNNPGVYTFKRRMGGVEVDVPGPFQTSPGELQRLLVCGGERVYRAVRARLGVLK